MKHMYDTKSLCPTCYLQIPAKIFYKEDNTVWMTKECPEHGHFEYMVEQDQSFWVGNGSNMYGSCYSSLTYEHCTCIEVSDRCNVQCVDCYHMPDNSIPDKPFDEIIKMGLEVETSLVTLMGAEPTMRDDLPEIIDTLQKSGKQVSIYSNFVRFSDSEYLRKIVDVANETFTFNISIHDPSYHNKNVWEKVQKGLQNLIIFKQKNYYKGGVAQLSFNIRNEKTVSEAIDKLLYLIKENKGNPICKDIIFRSPAEIGWKLRLSNEEIFASKIFEWVEKECNKRNLEFIVNINFGISPYKYAVFIKGIGNVVLIHWPSAKTIDYHWLNCGPYANFVKNAYSKNLTSQIIEREGFKRGWFKGKRIGET